jgi:hypothetical protein
MLQSYPFRRIAPFITKYCSLIARSLIWSPTSWSADGFLPIFTYRHVCAVLLDVGGPLQPILGLRWKFDLRRSARAPHTERDHAHFHNVRPRHNHRRHGRLARESVLRSTTHSRRISIRWPRNHFDLARELGLYIKQFS